MLGGDCEWVGNLEIGCLEIFEVPRFASSSSATELARGGVRLSCPDLCHEARKFLIFINLQMAWAIKDTWPARSQLVRCPGSPILHALGQSILIPSTYRTVPASATDAWMRAISATVGRQTLLANDAGAAES